MPETPTISLASAPTDVEAVRDLFRQYASALPVDLGYQDFQDELANLPGKYGPPRGVLMIARTDGGGALGCVGVRPLDAQGVCEMKRLFILPESRGGGLGRRLAEAAIRRAASLGYQEMWLDTLATMASAIALYEELGFRRRAPYYEPTPPGTIFMERRL